MSIQIIPSAATVSGGVAAEDFFKYSIRSTARNIENMYAGKAIAEAKPAKHQSVAPKNFMTFAVKKPLTHAVKAL